MGAVDAAPAVTTLIEDFGMTVYDIDWVGTGSARTYRVLVERDGGVDLDAVAEVSRSISALLDELDVPGPFQLEVSSPGIERPLRTLAHFQAAVGKNIAAKFRTETGAQRVTGILQQVNGDTHEAATLHLATETDVLTIQCSAITGAHVVFVWPETSRKKGS